MTESSATARPILHRDDFAKWYEDFEAYCGTKGLWRMCTGAELYPTPVDANALTRDERNDIEAHETRKMKASGEIWLGVEESLRDDGLREVKGEPAEILAVLEAKHNQKAPGIRFKAYNDFLNITLRNDVEPSLMLTTLVHDITTSLSFIRRQRPEEYTLDKLEGELATMVALRALRNSDDADHRSFATQFLMKEDLNFEDVESTIHRNFRSKPTIKQEELGTSLAMAAGQQGPCYLCGDPHFIRDCGKLEKAKKHLASSSSSNRRGRGRGWGAANPVESNGNTTPGAASASRATESAGKASAFESTTHRASWLKSRAATDWNTDTGASSHMTP
ncbi:hypothetical protein C8F04DRAFT_915772, partial [Mycena alexandri]